MSEKEPKARWIEALRKRAHDVPDDVGLTPEALRRLEQYLDLLSRWRGAVDLVGNLSDDDLVAHALESAEGSPLLKAAGPVVDIGSGAGFPGIPLAILGHEITLLEPRQRRAAFLRRVVRAIPGLKATVLAGRVESLSGPFDAATTRALGGFERRLGRGSFLKEGGFLLVWTSDATGLARELAPVFRLEAVRKLAGFRRKTIASFRRCSTGNNSAR